MFPQAWLHFNSVYVSGVLTILIFNITGVRQSNESTQQHMNWNGAGPSIRRWRNKPSTSTSASRHIIRGNATGHYLCMDDRSVVYQSVISPLYIY